jgi:hypothetical protein
LVFLGLGLGRLGMGILTLGFDVMKCHCDGNHSH